MYEKIELQSKILSNPATHGFILQLIESSIEVGELTFILLLNKKKAMV